MAVPQTKTPTNEFPNKPSRADYQLHTTLVRRGWAEQHVDAVVDELLTGGR
jgi:hypothetical protein